MANFAKRQWKKLKNAANKDSFEWTPDNWYEVFRPDVGTAHAVGQVKNIFNNISGKTTKDSIDDAAKKQEEAAKEAAAVNREIYYQSRSDMMPWMETGKQALGGLKRGINAGQFEMQPEEFDQGQYPVDSNYKMPGDFSFTMDDFQKTPYYQFLQDEGMRGIERSAAARGGLGSGQTMVALQDRAQNVAAGEFGNQFNRALGGYGVNLGKAQTDRQFKYGQQVGERDFGYKNFLGGYGRRADEKAGQYNRLASMANVGQVQSGNLANLGQGYGNNYSNLITQMANAQAAGQIGAANAQAQGTQNMVGMGLGALAYFSDKRLKRDIKPVGKFKDYTVYLFKYLWDDIVHLGVMAQDVLKINPDAVGVCNGFYYVKYGEL